MKIPFSPPDIGPQEIEEVIAALHSGWITTGPRTKEFEKQIAAYCHTERADVITSSPGPMPNRRRVSSIHAVAEFRHTALSV